ncbi:hypothetical protein CAP36_13050 [Chitinophagaceae bacterium IBVUCB2]|nr:hypothetical protein CAP36_13050 [Chitinophagaceae bacterium IBVUCB2]
MKKFLLTLSIFVSVIAQAQTYNNEWIDYNKTYYKFKVWVTGLYRINQPALSAMGLGAIPAEQFQLWRNGQEIPLYTSVQTGTMSGSDYIEFWGEMADGKPDKSLYRNPDYQLNDKWSGQTDTAAFFLTVNTSGNNLRFSPTANNLGGPLPTVEPFFLHNEETYYNEIFNQGFGAVVGSTIYSSAYDIGEGLTSANLGTGGIRTVTLSNLHIYTGPGAPDATFKLNAAGNSLTPRQVEVSINSNPILNQTMDFYDYIKATTTVPLANISSGTAAIQIKNASTTANDRMVIAKHQLIYPRIFDFGGNKNFYFELSANPAGNYLEITNFNHNGTAPILYDITNGKRYVVNIDNPLILKVLLLPSASARKLILVSHDASNIAQITTAQQRNFVNLTLAANQGNYLIISHPVLTNGTGGANPVNDYRAYRSSAVGGGFNAKVYMIDELIDQFGFGITKTPLSIRNFLMWARRNFTTGEIKNVFLIGKSVLYYQYRSNRAHADIEKLALIPSFGSPGSDILLSCEPGSEIPVTPIGRLSVIKADEITVYLNKVKQYEQAQKVSSPSINDQQWKKNIVHIVGASDQNLQRILDINMTNYKAIAQDTLYGANVHTFSKTSTDPVEQSNSVRLKSLFTEGIGVLTYFGHSSATTLEYNLDDPQNYNNTGKYPLFIFLGCNAGNFFNFNLARLQTNETISEKYVLANERGGIASLASSSLGIVHYLDIYNTRTYDAFSKTKYGKSIGEIMKETITQVFNLTTQNDLYARMQCEQTTLHGDPALKLNGFDKPDYAIEDPLVKVTPSFISVAESFFKLDAKFLNLGRATNKEIVIEIKRTYPDLTTEVIHRETIPGIRFADSLTYNIPIVATRDKGLNKITVTVDADNSVDELYETNNTITKDVFIFEDEARPIYPYAYSIVNRQDIKLIASTANPFVSLRQYNMEIDTTELFNSALKVTKSINSTGGVLEFIPGFTFRDSTVYYWRVAAVPTSGSPLWNTSSFIYLPNSDLGFTQSHYYQHVKSDKNNISLDAQSRNWKFDSSGHFIFAKNGVFLTATNQEGDLIVSPDGIPFIRSACIGYSLIFNIFNPLTFQPNLNETGRYGTPLPCTPTRRWNYEFSYLTTATRKLARDFMDSIPEGYIVVVRNIMNAGQVGGYINDWIADEPTLGAGNTLYHKLKNVGFNMLDSFTQSRAFIHMYVKGNNGFTPISAVSHGAYDVISLTGDFMTPDTVGYITSPAFGRAKAWKDVQWRGTVAPDVTPGDTPKLDIIGVASSGQEDVLFSGLDVNQQDFNISSINAELYPYLKLRMRNADSIHYTAYQLKFWKVSYDPVPEGVIAPNIYLKVKDTVDVGEPVDFKIAFKNVTNVDFDSVKVKMVITDKNNVPHIIPIPRKRKLPGNDPVNDTLHVGTLINTQNFSGLNTVYLEANPDDDQPEQYHFNNFAFRNLYVKADSLSPLLDVTFDGVHILNRDIVSSKPDIVIKLKDESKWMILNDTSLLTLNVRYPNGVIRRFYFNNDTLQFTPAGQAPSVDNTAMINFKPYFTEDGEYELIVTGKDRSENSAGAIEYRIIFEVINKPMISNMLNYPNPFTTSTAFVFTITGSEVPQNIKIEIMTITGKIVREITKDELGPLQIGRNITEFKWDGTDQYGQKLANGIYLYRVVTNLNGKSLDKYKSQNDKTDKYFNKGYGKMYLMR